MNSSLQLLASICAMIILNGCAGNLPSLPAARPPPPDQTTTLPPVGPRPKAEPPASRGNPDSYTVFGKRYSVKRSSAGYRKRGHASWYGPKFHGRLTSSGEVYDMHDISAAHKSLPIPTYARVTRLDTGRSIVVRINDRGPFIDGRLIDLSLGAAKALDMIDDGTALVEVEALAPYQDLDGNLPAVAAADQPPVPVAEPTAPAAQPATGTPSVALRPASPLNPASLEPIPTQTATAPPQTAPEPLFDRPQQVAFRPGAAPPGGSADIGTATTLRDPPPPAYLQIAAFAARDNAERLRQRLQRQLNTQTAVHTADSGIHRVRVGPLGNNPDTVDSLKLQLAELGFADAYLIYSR